MQRTREGRFLIRRVEEIKLKRQRGQFTQDFTYYAEES